MAFCKKCGAEISDNEVLCANCAKVSENVKNNSENAYRQATDFMSNVPDHSAEYTAEDMEQNKVYAILAYIGILFLVPILCAKESPFARFHANQGLVLFLFSIVCGIVVGILKVVLWYIPFVSALLTMAEGLITLALMIYGIYNAATGKAKELPILGRIKIYN